MKLIVDPISNSELSFITEGTEENPQKNLVFEGIFLQANVKNENKRIYPLDVLQESVADYVNNWVLQNRGYGELDHPEGVKINLQKASHITKELRWENTDCYGKAVITDTVCGNIVRGLHEAGGKLGVSSRGLGKLSEGRYDASRVVKYILRAIDIVADPSAPSAFVNGIMENVEYLVEGNEIIQVEADKIKKKVHRMNRRERDENTLKLFREFIEKVTV